MSYSFEILKIQADGQNVENHFLKQKEAASNLSVVFPGADHGLDISGDVLASVRTMEELIRKIVQFCY
jgi:hypothetical protein